MKISGRPGFTLIELLVVISIVGVISSVALVSLSSARNAAMDSASIQYMYQLKTALKSYLFDRNDYPPTIVGGFTVVDAGGMLLLPELFSKGYISTLSGDKYNTFLFYARKCTVYNPCEDYIDQMFIDQVLSPCGTNPSAKAGLVFGLKNNHDSEFPKMGNKIYVLCFFD